MKFSFLLITLLISLQSFAQDITGQWYGLLSVQGISMRLVFNVSREGDIYTSTLDSPDQKVSGIPVEATSFDGTSVKFTMTKILAEYTGKLENTGNFNGTFSQRGQNFPMILSREKIEKKENKRPQEPFPPFAYYTEDVKFKNEKEKVTLAGTLTLPKKEGKFPVVILISGSGPQNRDEELMGHKPFLVLADYLTKNGIGVLRYDDRGTNESEGKFSECNSINFANDVEAAIKYLQTRTEVDKKKIGLIGHSEGGLIAPMVASKNKNVAFIVLMAGPGISGGDILLMQQQLIGKSNGVSDKDLEETKRINTEAYKIIRTSKDEKDAKALLGKYYKTTIDELPAEEKPTAEDEERIISEQVNQLTGKWFYYFIKYDPYKSLVKTKCPVLALNGSKDLQVPPKENLASIKKAMEEGKNKNFTINELENLNHLFQECETGSPGEYASIEQTISPKALTTIASWINNLVK